MKTQVFYEVENSGDVNEGGYGHAVINVWLFTGMDYICDQKFKDDKLIEFSNRELFYLTYQNNQIKVDSEVEGMSPWYAEYIVIQEHPSYKMLNEILMVFKGMEKYEEKVKKMNLSIPARDDQMYFRQNLLEGSGAKKVSKDKESGIYHV
jgi:hypothetical protein